MKMITAISISPSVCWLDEASQIVRLLRGSVLDGIRNGNSAKPAENKVPMTMIELARNALRWCLRRVRMEASKAMRMASAARLQAQPPSAPSANQLPPVVTVFSNGFDGAAALIALLIE